jgi:hypothetical protein
LGKPAEVSEGALYWLVAPFVYGGVIGGAAFLPLRYDIKP